MSFESVPDLPPGVLRWERQAYRGTVLDDDFKELMAFYERGRKGGDFENGVRLAEDDDAKDIEKVNGSIEVEADQRVGDVSTVNGSIRIKDGATVEEAETVNGSVTLGERVVAESVETVNGTSTSRTPSNSPIAQYVPGRSRVSVNLSGSTTISPGSRTVVSPSPM